MSGWLARFREPRLWVVLLLGMASGLPLALVGGTLSARLSDGGVSLQSIGLFAYVALPYSIKFLWAPLVDRLPVPGLTAWLGRRKSWMLLSQLLVVAGLLGLSRLDPSLAPFAVALLALGVAVAAATQDICIDAYRTEFLPKAEYGDGAAMAVFGYRLGMLVSGAGALAWAQYVGWAEAYGAMAGVMLLGVALTLGIPRVGEGDAAAGDPGVKPQDDEEQGEFWREAVLGPFVAFMRRFPRWWFLLILVVSYRLPDGFIAFMTTPFLLHTGFEKVEIAKMVKLVGFAATILGMFVGGWGIARMGLYRALLAFGAFGVLANLSYVLLAVQGKSYALLGLAVLMDNLAGGMVSAAAIALMMRLCQEARYTATQYALLSALAAVGSTALAPLAGWMAAQWGWVGMFGFSAVLGVPAGVILMVDRVRLKTLCA